MQLPIEKWVAEQNFEESIELSYKEAFISYKAGAYRAALLFSYVGWGLCIRSRILRLSTVPNGIPQTRWDAIRAGLQDEDKWDGTVFESTQQKMPAPVFDVSEDVRKQVSYWKDRRNDCAHYKANTIEAAHVDAFWLFIKSNLGKFMPNGSRSSILEKIRIHYDRNFTPAGKSPEIILRQVPSSLRKDEYDTFLDEIEGLSWGMSEFSEVVDCLLGLVGQDEVKIISEYLFKKQERLMALLRRNPDRTLIAEKYPKIIRAVWKTRLFKTGYSDLPVYVALLKNGLIPKEEISEANERIARAMNDVVPKEAEKEILIDAGFIQVLYKGCFEDKWIDSFAWGNRHTAIISWLLNEFPITKTAVEAVCSVFSAEPYPFEVRTALQKFFAGNLTRRSEFEQLANDASCALPSVIFDNIEEDAGLGS